MMDKIDFGEFDVLEKIGGGVLGVIAIGAAIAELILGGVDAASIAGCIKDVAGTLIVVMVLIAALRRILPQNSQGFEAVFEDEMKKIIERYKPVIVKGNDKHTEKTVRKYIYNIAENLNCLLGEEPKNYNTEFFSIDETNCTITFKVRKSVFKGRSTEDVTAELKSIVGDVSGRVMFKFNELISHSEKKDNEFSLYYIEQETPEETARSLALIVDYVILLYIAENKK